MKVKCVKCGAEPMVRKDVLVARIVKAGSIEKLEATYLCRKCRPKNDIASAVAEANKILAEKAATEDVE